MSFTKLLIQCLILDSWLKFVHPVIPQMFVLRQHSTLPDTVLCAGAPALNKTGRDPCAHDADVLVGKID